MTKWSGTQKAQSEPDYTQRNLPVWQFEAVGPAVAKQGATVGALAVLASEVARALGEKEIEDQETGMEPHERPPRAGRADR